MKLEKIITDIDALIDYWVADDGVHDDFFNGVSMLKTLDEARDALELLRAKDINVPSKWVSVKDRLPTPDKYVLTLDNEGNYYVDRVLRDGRWQETESEWNPVKWWMPLPEPPREDEA